MAPTESTILTNFLLRPAQLPSITTLAQFTSFFPSAQQSSPEIKRLYRSLQSQRATLTDAITNNIAVEEKRGKILQRAVVYSRRRDEAGNGAAYDGGEEDEEGLIEKAVCFFTAHCRRGRSTDETRFLERLVDLQRGSRTL